VRAVRTGRTALARSAGMEQMNVQRASRRRASIMSSSPARMHEERDRHIPVRRRPDSARVQPLQPRRAAS